MLADFHVYLNTFLLKSYIHYKLNMLGLILTTTSLPPPVWTHNHCLFKLVLRHFLSAKWHCQNCFLWCQIKSDSSTDFFHLCQSNGDFTLHWLHDSVLFLGEIYTWRVVSGQLQFSSFKSSQYFPSVHISMSDQLQLLRAMVFSFLFYLITRAIAFVYILIPSLI